MNNCFYIVEVMYPSICGFGKSRDLIEIRECEKSEFPNCNSNGVWGYEKEGIFYQWYDMNLYTIDKYVSKHLLKFIRSEKIKEVLDGNGSIKTTT